MESEIRLHAMLLWGFSQCDTNGWLVTRARLFTCLSIGTYFSSSHCLLDFYFSLIRFVAFMLTFCSSFFSLCSISKSVCWFLGRHSIVIEHRVELLSNAPPRTKWPSLSLANVSAVSLIIREHAKVSICKKVRKMI